MSTWEFFSQTSGNIEADATLKVVCDGGCSADPPAAPADSASDWDGSSKGVGTVVTYSCTSGDKKYAQCGADGNWSPSTVPECGDPGATSSPGTTTKKPGKKLESYVRFPCFIFLIALKQ